MLDCAPWDALFAGNEEFRRLALASEATARHVEYFVHIPRNEVKWDMLVRKGESAARLEAERGRRGPSALKSSIVRKKYCPFTASSLHSRRAMLCDLRVR